MLLLVSLFLFNSVFAQNELLQQFQSDVENFSEQMEVYQESDTATEWELQYQEKELEKLQAKYRQRKVKSACGTCPLNSYMQQLTENRLKQLLQDQQLSRSLWTKLMKGMYYFSYDTKKEFGSYHVYKSFIEKKTKHYFIIDQIESEALQITNKAEKIFVYIYKTHELYIEVLYNHSKYPIVRVYQISEELLNSAQMIFKKYNFQDPEFNIPTELSFQKFVDYNGKLLDFHSDVQVGTGEFLTELDYHLKGIAKGELVFSGTNDNTQTTIRHNLKTGTSSNVSLYLKTYYLDRMTPEQRSKTPVYEGNDLRQSYWGLEWRWIFDSK